MWFRISRLLRHRWQRDDLAQTTLPVEAQQRLAQRIAEGEKRHRGQIRVHIEGALPTSYLWTDLPTAEVVKRRALRLFGKLQVWDTEENNGVLIYLLLTERRLEIIADRGIHRRVAPDTWQRISAQMRVAFQSGAYESGLAHAIDTVHALLAAHFPRRADTKTPNELPDEPTLT
ncbi:MAG: TPM domain-containing protein [Rhodoferax sp.]